MAKLTDRTALVTPADGDFYVTTDISDTTDAATGTDKKITWANIKAGMKTYTDTLYATVLGTDDNYVTDAEKTKIGHISVTQAVDLDAIETASHAAVTKAGTATYISLSGQQITADPIDTTDLAVGVLDTDLSSTSASDDTIPSAKATKAMGDAKALLAGSTGQAFQVSQLEIGHASDTTLARVSAGVASIEGNNILTSATGLPLAGGTMSGNITLGENTSLALDPAGSADGKYSGITIAGTAGATLAFGDLCYLAVADSRWELADADAAATMGTPLLGMCVLAAAGDASATTMLLYGTCRADAKFPALTIGATVYGGETAGAIQTAIPTGADNIIRVVGHALTADEIMFNPSQDHQVTIA